jgi:hypothetical protein
MERRGHWNRIRPEKEGELIQGQNYDIKLSNKENN